MFDSLAVLVTLSRLNSRTVWVGITGRIGATFTSFTTTAKALVALRHPAVNSRRVRFRRLGQPFILNITRGLGEGLHGRRNSRAFAAAYDGREAGVDRGCSPGPPPPQPAGRGPGRQRTIQTERTSVAKRIGT